MYVFGVMFDLNMFVGVCVVFGIVVGMLVCFDDVDIVLFE